MKIKFYFCNLKTKCNRFDYNFQIEEYCSRTTAHGVSHITKKNAIAAYKVCWMFIVIGALTGNIYHLYWVLSDYMQYPTHQSVSFQNDIPVFPDVTICNQSPYSKMALSEVYNNDDPDNELRNYEERLDNMGAELRYYSESTGVSYGVIRS